VNYLELLLRQTPFCQMLLATVWDGLDTWRRIDLFLLCRRRRLSLPQDVLQKAACDPNAVVRMLAIRHGHFSNQDNPELYACLKSDTSPLVKAAMKSGSWFMDAKDFEPLSHIERLGAIALADSLTEEAFAKFICDGLKNGTLPELEAAELVGEYVRNPALTENLMGEPEDGLDWYSLTKDFEAIWNLTTCTPWPVHHTIAWEFPLSNKNDPTGEYVLSDKIIDNMSEQALEALAYRQCRPLLKKLQQAPEKFGKKIHDAASSGADLHSRRKPAPDLTALWQDFDEFRTEIRVALEALKDQIAEAASRKRGLFG